MKTKDLTRARAEKIIANTTDISVLESNAIKGHKNKHVVQKAKNKLARLT